MRRIRWKSSWATGDREKDRRTRALVDLVSMLGGELGRREHCQDMTELCDRLGEAVWSYLEGVAAGSDSSGEEIRRLLAERLPLAARSTPACRDCGLCDLLEDRVGSWLGDAPNR